MNYQQAFINGFYNRLREDEPCGTQSAGVGQTSNLYDALNDAINHLNANSEPDRVKKIVIFSSRANTKDQNTICQDFENKLAPTKSGIDVIMINIPKERSNAGQPSAFDPYTTSVGPYQVPSEYLKCLTNFDDSRIEYFTRNKDLTSDLQVVVEVIDVLQDEICSTPTTSPTTVPTRDPTADPTVDPTRDPTTDPTQNPTESPIACPSCACTDDWSSDFIFLIDTGCVPSDECGDYTEGIAELASSMKPRYAPRFGVITFDGTDSPIVQIPINDTEFNNFAEGSLNEHDHKEFYDRIRALECNGNNGDPTIKKANTISAIDEAMRIFEYEETTYLPEISCEYTLYPSPGTYSDYSCRGVFTACKHNPPFETNALPALSAWQARSAWGDCRNRYKKIVIFSACLNTENIDIDGGEPPSDDPVCSAYQDENDRTPVAGAGEVEITIFNVFTTESTISATSYQCLTEDDENRRYFGGEDVTPRQPITLDGIVGNYGLPDGSPTRLQLLPFEICETPTAAPTTDPTLSPTEDPTKSPTSEPTTSPTKPPSKAPTLPPVPLCNCDHLAFEFEMIENSCDNPNYARSPDIIMMPGEEDVSGDCHVCTPYDCDLGFNCWRYKMKPKQPYTYIDNPACTNHNPSFIVLPPKNGCTDIWGPYTDYHYTYVLKDVVDETDPWFIMGWNYLTFDDMMTGPEPITGLTGIQIPISIYDPFTNEFHFEICLYGVKDTTSDLNIGYGYSVQNCQNSPPEEYGYDCPTDTPFPDICNDDIMAECSLYLFAHKDDGEQVDDDNNNKGVDLLGSNNNNKKSKHNIFSMYTSYSQWIFIGIMAIFALNIFICAYIKCIRKNNTNMSSRNNKKYGAIEKDDESDDSDGTDSEIDSDESAQQLMQ